MNKQILAAIASLSVSFPAFAAKAKCDLPEWRELSHEASILKAHAGIAQRAGNQLKILLENGKSIELNDRHEGGDPGHEPGAASDIHRVIDAGPHGEWVTVFETGSDSFGYKVIHRKSGKVEDLGGCPIWSKNGNYFVALHEDLESGKTSNEASLWYCENPSEGCVRTWNAPSSEGGRDAQWSGSKVRITLSKIDMDREGQPEMVQTVTCSPNKAKPGCIKPKPWKKAGK